MAHGIQCSLTLRFGFLRGHLFTQIRMRGKVLNRYQLFNESHKREVLQLLEGAKPLGSTLAQVAIEEKGGRVTQEALNQDVEDEKGPELELDGVETLDVRESVSNQVLPSAQVQALVCTTCGLQFETLQEQRLHFRLDLHRYNIKRKSQSQPPVSEEEFDNLMDGLSSISGSEEEESVSPDRQLNRLLEKVNIADQMHQEGEDKDVSGAKQNQWLSSHVKRFYKSQGNEIFAIYKAIFPSVKTDSLGGEVIDEIDYMKRITTTLPNLAVIMISGGHFAAGIFQGLTDTVHKTFHSYTVRAKQGGSQGARDNKSATSHPKSAGASLRRYNEQSFKQHVQELLSSWKERLDSCHLIFYRAVSSNQNTLFGGGDPPLNRSDVRLRTIPFPTKRPTYSEVKRVLANLSALEVLDLASMKEPFNTLEKQRKKVDQVKSSIQKSRSKIVQEDPAPSASSPEPPEIEDLQYVVQESLETVEFTEALQEYGDSLTPAERKKSGRKEKPAEPNIFRPTGDFGELLSAIESSNEQLTKEMISRIRQKCESSEGGWNSVVDAQSLTLLHHAAKRDLQETIWLLLESGCDPSVKDITGKVPYNYSPTKEGRRVFMRFLAEYPEKYDYSRAQIPGPLTKEMEQERAEKQKLINKTKREKEKQKKLARKEQQAELDEKRRFLSLSDREKRALAAERRILGQATRSGEKPVLIRCFDCAIDITGKVPFEYNQNVFCSPKCLAAHRKKFPTPLTC